MTSCVSLCKDATTIKVVTVKLEVAMIEMIELASVETVKVTRISWTSFLKEKEWFLLVVAGFALQGKHSFCSSNGCTFWSRV